MTAISLTYAELRALRPCTDRLDAVAALFGGARKWGARRITAAEAVAAGVPLDDLVWVAFALARRSPDVRRRLRLWLADCAAHVLPLFERARPDDERPRQAIVIARRFARGEVDTAAWDAAWNAAMDSARDSAWDASSAVSAAAWAASDATRATAWAAREAARTAAWAAAWAAWDAAAVAWTARDAAWAAAGDAATAARAAEEAWQLDRLVAWLSDPEPDDWPLPLQAAA